jgi:hypothetical protein
MSNRNSKRKQKRKVVGKLDPVPITSIPYSHYNNMSLAHPHQQIMPMLYMMLPQIAQPAERKTEEGTYYCDDDQSKHQANAGNIN